MYWASLVDQRLIVTRYPDRSRVLMDVSPDGQLFLTTPHSDGPVQVHAFPNGDIVSSLSPEGVLAEDDSFDFFAGFLDADSVVLTTHELDSVVVAAARRLDRWSVVPVPIRRAGEALFVGHGRFVTSAWGSGVADVWSLG
jgi:hypothetical protein